MSDPSMWDSANAVIALHRKRRNLVDLSDRFTVGQCRLTLSNPC